MANDKHFIDYGLFNPEWRTKRENDKYLYSGKDALSLALACSIAREHHDKREAEMVRAIKRQLKKWGFEHYEPFEAKHSWDIDTQGYLASNDKRVLIAFRGADSVQDWRTNFQTTRDPGPFDRTQVHSGFQEAFLPVSFDIGRLLERYYTKGKELWITGHSLGGAHAVLMVANLISRGIQPTGLYTFGAPRVGDKKFKRKFDREFKGVSFRLVNEHDLICHIPFEGFFSHTGNRMILLDNSEQVRTDKPKVWSDIKEAMWGWMGKVAGKEGAFTTEDYHRLPTEKGYLYQLRKDLNLL